jgi:hypothetical protein
MNDDNELGWRLAELFAESNLTLMPRPVATGLVLSRVRQVRRRHRAIRIAVPVLSGVVLGGAAISGLGPWMHAPPTPAARITELPMTGLSVGPLRLGMSLAEVRATGLVVPANQVWDADRPYCWAYNDGPDGIAQVLVSRYGLYRISVYAFIHTAQGDAIGDTYAQLQAEYPDAMPTVPDGRNEYRVPVPGQPGAWYLFTFDTALLTEGHPVTRDTRMVELGLVNDDHSCD